MSNNLSDNLIDKANAIYIEHIPANYEFINTFANSNTQNSPGTLTFKIKHKLLNNFFYIYFLNLSKYLDDTNFQTDKEIIIKKIKELGQIKHANLAKIQQIGFPQEDIVFIIYEIPEGISLSEYLQAGHKLSTQATSYIIDQIIDCLDYCHNHNVLHGNIDSSNIFLLPEISSSSLFHICLANCSIDLNLIPKNNKIQVNEIDIISLIAVLIECFNNKKLDLNILNNATEIKHILLELLKKERQALPQALQNYLSEEFQKNEFSFAKFKKDLHKILKKSDSSIAKLPKYFYALTLIICLILSITLATIFDTLRKEKNKFTNIKEKNKPSISFGLHQEDYNNKHQIKYLLDKTDSIFHIPEEEREKAFEKIIEEATKLSFQLKNKPEKLYQIFALKAFIFLHLHKYDEGRESLFEAIKYTKLKNNISTKQTAECFSLLAQFSRNLAKNAESKKYAWEAAKLANRETENYSLPSLQLDGNKDPLKHNKYASESYHILAALAESEGQLKDALKYIDKAIDNQIKSYPYFYACDSIRTKGGILDKLGKEKESVDLITKFCQNSIAEDPIRTSNAQTYIESLLWLAEDLDKHKKKKLALDLIHDLLEIQQKFIPNNSICLNKLKQAQKSISNSNY